MTTVHSPDPSFTPARACRSAVRPASVIAAVRRGSIAAVLVAALGLGACATENAGNKQVGGTVLGAVAGGLAGSAFGRGEGRLIMTGLGTLLGAFIGSEVGQSLDRADRIAAQNTAQRTLEYGRTGQTATWSNPDSGHSGSVTPTRTYQDADGAYCREYQQTVTVGSKTEQAYGRACRQPDGSWKIMNS
ncbi:MAG: 17 kDa surface antigen precursor [Pseudomonadota bacterium]|jgi:surface antigen